MLSPRPLLLLALAVCVCLVSCSPTTEKAERAKPGTPAYYWTQAQTAWEKGDYVTTVSNLERLSNRDGEYRQQAQTWLMAIHAGLAKGDMDWADTLDAGRKLSRSGEATFRREIAAARSAASQAVMNYLELANQQIAAGVSEEPPVNFTAAPAASRPVEIKKLEKGILPPTAEMELIRDRLRAQAIASSTKAFMPVGEADKRNQYLGAVASELLSLCDLYNTKRLNESGRVRMITQVAGVAVEKMTPCDKSKELRKKIQALEKNPTKPLT